jgi:hypothetical protein
MQCGNGIAFFAYTLAYLRGFRLLVVYPLLKQKKTLNTAICELFSGVLRYRPFLMIYYKST